MGWTFLLFNRLAIGSTPVQGKWNVRAIPEGTIKR
jgi:hypothetical protein